MSTRAVSSPMPMAMSPVWQEWVAPLVAEAIGAFALTFIGVSVIATTSGDLVAAAFAQGLAIGLMVAAAGHISGGAYNPAVCIGFVVARKITIPKAVGYVIAELIGATIAALFVKAIIPDAVLAKAGYGVPDVGPGYSVARAFFAEAVLTFFLMYVIFGTGLDKRGPGAIAGLAIGLTITMDIFAQGAVSGAAMNPSRHFGAALVFNHWHAGWVYYVAPALGAAIASAIYYIFYLRGALQDGEEQTAAE